MMAVSFSEYEHLKALCHSDPDYCAARERFRASETGSREEAIASNDMCKAASRIHFPDLSARVREKVKGLNDG